MTSKHRKTTQPSDKDLRENPGIGTSKGTIKEVTGWMGISHASKAMSDKRHRKQRKAGNHRGSAVGTNN